MVPRSAFTTPRSSEAAAVCPYTENVPCTLQACPVCSHKEYKVAVLSALPHLTNLDGERNPHTCVYLDTLDQTHQSHEKLKQYDPEFKYDPPEPWFTPDVLMVPPVTFPDARRSLCVALEVAGKRIIRLESELHATQKLIFQRQ